MSRNIVHAKILLPTMYIPVEKLYVLTLVSKSLFLLNDSMSKSISKASVFKNLLMTALGNLAPLYMLFIPETVENSKKTKLYPDIPFMNFSYFMHWYGNNNAKMCYHFVMQIFTLKHVQFK